MALDLFRVIDGVAIQLDDQSAEAWQLVGDGAPLGTSGNTADAPIGSLWLRTDTETDKLNIYWKHADTDSPTDWIQAASKDYVDTAVQGISWREPVRYLDAATDDNFTTIAAAIADMNANDQLGTNGAVAAGDRILFGAMGAGDGGPNVYIVGGSTGAWTLTEDTNNETDGDAVLVNEGIHADEQWIYDGTNWIQFGGAGSATELVNIRNFIGKPTSGSILPQYQSNLILSDNDNLTTAAGKLDLHMGDAQYSSNNVVTDFTPDYTNTSPTDWTGEAGDNITDAIGQIDAQFGSGLITNIGSNFSLSDELSWNAAGTLTITDAFEQLNNAVGDRTYTEDNIVTDGQSVAASIDALDQELGDLNTAGSWTTGGFLDQTTLANNDVQENIDAINQEVGDISNQNYENSVTNFNILTELESGTLSASSDATEILWHVQVKINGDGTRRRSFLVHAMTDGTNVDWNRSSVINLGSPGVGNLNVNVSISGGNWSFTMNPTNAIDATIKRYSYSLLA
jgi:hypothetical protein